MNKVTLIGPFAQAITMDSLPTKGPLSDDHLQIIDNAGILVSGEVIEAVGSFREMKSLTPHVQPVQGETVVFPGLIDVHTHLCWAGSRAGDYAMRLRGESYPEIARQGGGIWSTVTKTREAGSEELAALLVKRAERLLLHGITTVEVKSGYGLDAANELKMLVSIRMAAENTYADLIPTCLAAHIKPRDFNGSPREYLDYVLQEILPRVKADRLSNRVDIYVDDGAFGTGDALHYLNAAGQMGFELVVHADQFSRGGVGIAVATGAVSADHLEESAENEIRLIAASNVIPVALPGSSLGLGAAFAPARKLLDAGASLAIASDWNPGSAPMGNLMLQAAVLGMYEKLTMAETLAAISFRAASALRLNDRGVLKPGMVADFVAFPCSDYREILYNQGAMLPEIVWKRGIKLVSNRHGFNSNY